MQFFFPCSHRTFRVSFGRGTNVIRAAIVCGFFAFFCFCFLATFADSLGVDPNQPQKMRSTINFTIGATIAFAVFWYLSR